jgi:sporulation protein YlmC with PRC-barrel domain
MSSLVRFEDLIGRLVRNSHGRAIGRIQDATMEPDGEDYLITHFLLGPVGRTARLRAFLGELPVLRNIRLGKERDLRPLPWHWFDLTDPEQPVLSSEAPTH